MGLARPRGAFDAVAGLEFLSDFEDLLDGHIPIIGRGAGAPGNSGSPSAVISAPGGSPPAPTLS